MPPHDTIESPNAVEEPLELIELTELTSPEDLPPVLDLPALERQAVTMLAQASAQRVDAGSGEAVGQGFGRDMPRPPHREFGQVDLEGVDAPSLEQQLGLEPVGEPSPATTRRMATPPAAVTIEAAPSAQTSEFAGITPKHIDIAALAAQVRGSPAAAPGSRAAHLKPPTEAPVLELDLAHSSMGRAPSVGPGLATMRVAKRAAGAPAASALSQSNQQEHEKVGEARASGAPWRKRPRWPITVAKGVSMACLAAGAAYFAYKFYDGDARPEAFGTGPLQTHGRLSGYVGTADAPRPASGGARQSAATLAHGAAGSQVSTSMLQPPKVPPLPAPQITVLSWSSVDALDYASLRAGVATLAAATDADLVALRQWAIFRLAMALGDGDATRARAATWREVGRAHASPAVEIARAADKVRLDAQATGATAINGLGLSRRAQRQPQARWLMLWTQGHAHGSARPTPAESERALERLVADSPAMADARVLLGRWTLADAPIEGRMVQAMGRPDGMPSVLSPTTAGGAASHVERVAQWAAAAQAAGDADTQARLLALLWSARQWAYIEAALGPAEADDTAGARASLARAAPQHRDLLWRLRAHRQVRAGALAQATVLATQRAQDPAAPPEARAEQARLLTWRARAEASVSVGIAAPSTTGKPTAVEDFWRAVGRALNVMAPVAQASGAPGVAAADASALGWPDADAIGVMLSCAKTLPPFFQEFADALRRVDWPHAAQALDGLLWRDPTVGDPIDNALRLALLRRYAGDAAAAATAVRALVDVAPNDDRPVATMARLAHADGDSVEEILWRKQLVQRHPDDTALSVALAQTLVDAARGAEALALLNDVAAREPLSRNPSFLVIQGRALGQQNPVAARGLLLAATRAQPMAQTYVYLADLEETRGNLDEAAEALRQASALAPMDRTIKVRLARLLVPRGGLDEAARVLQGVLALQPDAFDVAEALGDIYHERGALHDAAAMYGRAMSPQQPQARVLQKLALLQLHELRELSAAMQTLRRAVAASPDQPEPHYYLGLVLHDKGELSEAKKELQLYLALAPHGNFADDCAQSLREME